MIKCGLNGLPTKYGAKSTLRIFGAALLVAIAWSASAETIWPNQRQVDAVLKDFGFGSGEVLPELKLHYVTMGTAKRDASGKVINAALLLHSTSSTGIFWKSTVICARAAAA
jgi:hypothetical protein